MLSQPDAAAGMNPTVGSTGPGTVQAAPDHLQAPQRRHLLQEALIGTVMSGLVPAVVIALVRRPLPMPVWGPHGLYSSLLAATLLPGIGAPIILTLVVRSRVRRGIIPGLSWPLRNWTLAQYLPQGPLWLRGLVTGGAATLVLPAAGVAVLMACGVSTVSGIGFIAYNFIHGMALGAFTLPPAIIRAMADSPRK